jgi:hypothetical protein
LPDSGYNGYLSIGADGRVVVPNNLTPEGLAVAADLATHADLDASATATYNSLVSDYSLDTVIHDPGELDVYNTVKMDRGDGGHDVGYRQIGPARSIPVFVPAGQPLGIVTGGPYPEIVDVAEWTVFGYLGLSVGTASVGSIRPTGAGDDHLDVEIIPLSGGGAVSGNFFFHVLWGTDPNP